MPCFNLAGTVAENIRAVDAALSRMGIPCEIVPVDDGSGDGTGAAIEAIARELCGSARSASLREKKGATATPNPIIPVILPRNGGKGAALKAGVARSSGSHILLLDGDLDISIETLPAFFESMARHGADIVVGSKRHPASQVSYPWHRRLASACYFAGVRLLTGVKVSDTQAGMKLFRREALVYALDRMLVKTFAFDLEILAIAREHGAVIAEAPIKLDFKGTFGCMRPSTVLDMVRDTLAVFYRLRILRYYRKVHVPPPAATKPFFSVVIACPAPSAMLQECLDALAAQTYPRFEVIVLPDAAIDGNRMQSNAIENLTVVPTGKVRPAEKRNEGIRLAKGDVVAFIDDDAYPAPDWLGKAAGYFADPAIGAVGGPGVTPPGDPFLAKAGGRVYDNPLVSGGYRYRYVAGLAVRDVDDYPSCNLFVRTALLREIGGYRTDFWPGEDTLLCEDIVYRAKKRIVYDPWTIVYHHRRPLFGPHLKQLTRYALHRGYFAKRHPKTSLKLAYFVPSLFVVYTALWLAVLAIVPLSGRGHLARECFGWLSVPMAAYWLLVAATSFSFNPAMWLTTALGVFASHVGYGLRFIQGLCSTRMPCEYRGVV